MIKDLLTPVFYSFTVGVYLTLALVSFLYDKPGMWFALSLATLYVFLTHHYIKEFVRTYKEKE